MFGKRVHRSAMEIMRLQRVAAGRDLDRQHREGRIKRGQLALAVWQSGSRQQPEHATQVQHQVGCDLLALHRYSCTSRSTQTDQIKRGLLAPLNEPS